MHVKGMTPYAGTLPENQQRIFLHMYGANFFTKERYAKIYDNNMKLYDDLQENSKVRILLKKPSFAYKSYLPRLALFRCIFICEFKFV